MSNGDAKKEAMENMKIVDPDEQKMVEEIVSGALKLLLRRMGKRAQADLSESRLTFFTEHIRHYLGELISLADIDAEKMNFRV
jgi:hypothetical protein